MKIKFLEIALSLFLALGEAKQYKFNVVSILGEGSSLGVKYGETVTKLPETTFPLFSGTVEADNISQYKYVAFDAAGTVIE